MNTNLFRTLLTIAAVAVTFAGSILGCTTDATGNSTCTAAWLSPQLAGIAATGFMVLNLILKAFQGGDAGAGLVSPTAVLETTGKIGTAVKVVSATDPESGPGNVTPAQVSSK